MKIAILTDILDRTEKKTGVGVYCEQLIKHLLIFPGDNKFYLVHYKKNNNPIYRQTKEIIIPSLPFPIFFKAIFTGFLRMPAVLKREKIDLLHILSPTLHETPLFFLQGFKKILTVHDLYPFLPEVRAMPPYPNFKVWILHRLRKIALLAIKDNVDKYIAVSNNTKQDLMRYLGVPEEKIKVIYLGPDEKFRQINVKIPNFIDSSFILSNDINAKLIEIFYRLRKKRVRNKLVIFGEIHKSGKNKLNKVIKNLNLGENIIFLGYVPGEELVRLYNTADLFIRFPWCEGFGLPSLEAMACGCPVIVSNVGSLPEVVGDAGVLVNVDDMEEWVEKIYYILTHEDFRRELIQKGLEQAKKFSWEKTAKETLETYHQVLQ